VSGEEVAAVDVETIPVFVMGQRVEVPPTLTILRALEYAGYTLTRGVGCRAGFCGACATVYRLKGDPRLYFALACQTVVAPTCTGTDPFPTPGRLPPGAGRCPGTLPLYRNAVPHTCGKSLPAD
jgi:hypothetical protein